MRGHSHRRQQREWLEYYLGKLHSACQEVIDEGEHDEVHILKMIADQVEQLKLNAEQAFLDRQRRLESMKAGFKNMEALPPLNWSP